MSKLNFWRAAEDTPTRVVNNLRYRAYTHPHFLGGEIYVLQHGGAGGPRNFAAIHADHDIALEMGRDFAVHYLNRVPETVRHIGGAKKERGWWLSFEVSSLD